MSKILEVIDECHQNVSHVHYIYPFSKILSNLHDLESIFGNERRPQRDESISSEFDEFVVDAPIPSSDTDYDDACKLRNVAVDLEKSFEEESVC